MFEGVEASETAVVIADGSITPQARSMPPKEAGSCPTEGCGGELRTIDLGRIAIEACPVCKFHRKSPAI